ncbi:MAG: MBL fold metallo-hydrolase [Deltaproteobacteria bacterium]|nr:MBL fold metallo-hydrolase [Deltaproteobacteria bacterium]
MRITIIYDNEAKRKDLTADWGFACLVEEADTPTILFDTGGRGAVLMANMKRLGIDPRSVDEVFISHAHFDHTGGLSAFLEQNNDVILYAPVSFRGVHNVKQLVYVSDPIQIHHNVFSTGELDGIEQTMAVATDQGLVLVVGCSHPNMAHILGAASQFGKVYGIVGGLHGFQEFELFKDMGLICPTHCTQFKSEIRARYPDTCVEGGAGTVIEIATGGGPT